MENNGKSLRMWEFSKPEFELLQNVTWEFTEKLDGTCIRVMLDGPTEANLLPALRYGGKTDNAQIPAQLVQRLRDLFDPQVDLLRQMFPEGGVCIYGEGVGKKIQKVGHLYGDTDFVVFDVRVGRWWLKREDVEDVATKLGLKVAPVIGHGNIETLVNAVRKGIKSQWGDFTAEGIVARPQVELLTRGGERIITKLKTRDFAACS